MPIHKNKTSKLKIDLHQAPRFVQVVSKEVVFADKRNNCKGSCALIVIYRYGLSRYMMQKIARASRYPATVFINSSDAKKHTVRIRWFNSTHEIQRCGHGTLAAAQFLQEYQSQRPNTFKSKVGDLFLISSFKKILRLHLSIICSRKSEPVKLLDTIIPIPIIQTYQTSHIGGYTTVIIKGSISLKDLTIDIDRLKNYPHSVIVMQKNEKSSHWHFRYFSPYYGVNEDNATASAISVLAPIIHLLDHVNKGIIYQDSANSAKFNYLLNEKTITTF